MYEVTVNTTISASHHLRGYQGKCEQVHGHNWKIEATVATEELDECGLAIDFGALREHLRKATENLDHTDLNSLPEYKDLNPSSENLARLVFARLRASFAGGSLRMIEVKVWETEGAFAAYHEGR